MCQKCPGILCWSTVEVNERGWNWWQSLNPYCGVSFWGVFLSAFFSVIIACHIFKFIVMCIYFVVTGGLLFVINLQLMSKYSWNALQIFSTSLLSLPSPHNNIEPLWSAYPINYILLAIRCSNVLTTKLKIVYWVREWGYLIKPRIHWLRWPRKWLDSFFIAEFYCISSILDNKCSYGGFWHTILIYIIY